MIDVSVQKANERTDKSSLSLISCDKWYILKWQCLSLTADLYQEAKTPVSDNKTIFLIPTIKVYRKNDNAKIINI